MGVTVAIVSVNMLVRFWCVRNVDIQVKPSPSGRYILSIVEDWELQDAPLLPFRET